MLSHDRLWHAIDALAAKEGISPSYLARLAGLDASIFNRSKRFHPNGRPRWPSTESIARILSATGLSTEAFFVELVGGRRSVVWSFEDILEGKAAKDIPPLIGDPPIRPPFTKEAAPTDLSQLFTEGYQPEALAPCERVFLLVIDDDGFSPFFKRGASLLLGLFCPIAEEDRVILFKAEGYRNSMILGDITPNADAGLCIRPLLEESPDIPVTEHNRSRISRVLWASQ